MTPIETVSDLIRQIKTAVQMSMPSLDESGLQVSAVNLEVKTTLVASGKAGVKFRVIPLSLKGSYEESEVQTITMSMVPIPAGIELFAPVSDNLKEAIDVITEAVREAARSTPLFHLTEASVELKLGVTKEGGIEILIGAEAKGATTHTVKLTLSRLGG